MHSYAAHGIISGHDRDLPETACGCVRVIAPCSRVFYNVALRRSPACTQTAGPTLRIVKDTLIDSDNFYIVKGNIYNPNNDGVKNVVIKYYVWKKWMGKDGHGSAIKETGGLVSAKIKYLPPKQTVDFVANDGTAPVMTPESGLVPDPISAEITADWDE